MTPDGELETREEAVAWMGLHGMSPEVIGQQILEAGIGYAQVHRMHPAVAAKWIRPWLVAAGWTPPADNDL